jgi:hypothetical protein
MFIYGNFLFGATIDCLDGAVKEVDFDYSLSSACCIKSHFDLVGRLEVGGILLTYSVCWRAFFRCLEKLIYE